MPMICPKTGVAYFDAPKVASSSIKIALHALETGEDEESYRRLHNLYRAKRARAEDFQLAAALWKFAVVRDPVKRMLSLYNNRIVSHRDQLRGWKSHLRLRLLLLPFEPTANEFYENLRTYPLTSGILLHHVRPQRHFLGDDLSRFDAVFPIENMGALEAALSERVGRQIALPRVHAEAGGVSWEQLSAKARRKILAATASDFRLLADYYSPPSAEAAPARSAPEPRPDHLPSKR